MLQFLADNIDQLDLALDQLAVSDRNFDRFALMLVDNVVELTLHRFVQDRAAENEFWGKLREPKYDPKIVEKGLNQAFDNKAKAARDLGFYNDQLCKTFLYLHSFRNTAYHQGLRHEGILHSLAIFYYINACHLLLNYEPRYWGWSSKDVYSHRARKYIGDIKMLDHKEVFRASFTRLREVAESLKFDFTEDLAADMEASIKEADRLINYLANDAPDKRTRNQVIVDVQAWPFSFTDEASEFAKANGCKEKSVGAYVEWIAENFPWKIASDPIDSWRRRLAALRQQKNPHEVLLRYCEFMTQTRTLRSQIEEAAGQLDAHIDYLIEASRTNR